MIYNIQAPKQLSKVSLEPCPQNPFSYRQRQLGIEEGEQN